MRNKRFLTWVFKRAAVCLAFVFILHSSAWAQTESADDPKNEFGVRLGASPASSTVFGIGRTPDARYGTLNLRYSRRFNNSDAVNLKYVFELTPVSLLNFPDFRAVQTAANALTIVEERRTARAFGVAPLGLQINFRPRRKLQPFVNSSGGLLYFDKRIPRDVGTRFVFTADLGGGVEYKLKNNRAVAVGYKYLHLSNGGRGIENPGFDNNVFYVGYSFLR